MNVKITGETVLEIQIIMSILFPLKKLVKFNKKFSSKTDKVVHVLLLLLQNCSESYVCIFCSSFFPVSLFFICFYSGLTIFLLLSEVISRRGFYLKFRSGESPFSFEPRFYKKVNNLI